MPPRFEPAREQAPFTRAFAGRYGLTPGCYRQRLGLGLGAERSPRTR